MELLEFENSRHETLRGLLQLVGKDVATLFVHGFERTTIEDKFRNIVNIISYNQTTLRFDFAGCGLSDGDFFDTTVKKMTEELEAAVRAMDQKLGETPIINLVAHSLGCCVAVQYASNHLDRIGRMVLIAPAFNQKALTRLWFAQGLAKKKNPPIAITWDNYASYVEESELKAAYAMESRPTKAHLIGTSYFQENEGKDYQDLIQNLPSEKIMIVQSIADDKVPPQSNDRIPEGIRMVMLDKADHDLQKVTDVEQYLEPVKEFLLGV